MRGRIGTLNHDDNPELRPAPIGPEQREEIIVQMAAGIVLAYRYFQRRARQNHSDTHRGPIREKPEGTNRVRADLGRNTNAVAGA